MYSLNVGSPDTVLVVVCMCIIASFIGLFVVSPVVVVAFVVNLVVVSSFVVVPVVVAELTITELAVSTELPGTFVVA